ncbi:MAG: choice-of-anchor L domain-containing protein [Polyangiaceae bacterium]
MSRARFFFLGLCLAACGARHGGDSGASSIGNDAGFTADAGPGLPGGCTPDPGNFEVPGNGCDDDGDGTIDNAPTCDTGLSALGNADDFAKAIGLCNRSSGADDPNWGVVSAAFTRGHASTTAPADGQHEILPTFGKVITAREGSNLGAMSTGWARPYDNISATTCAGGADLLNCFKEGVAMQGGTPTANAAPAGYPKATGQCTVSNVEYDAVDLVLNIKVPKNALGFGFDFDFWSGEWPDYVCTQYNDSFIAYLQSQAFNGGVPENIAFDSAKNPVSVNNAFFDRCTLGTQTGCKGMPQRIGTSTCGGSLDELMDTGFYATGQYCNAQLSTGGGATGWLTTQAPVQAGEIITLEFLIWDTGDPKFDSTVLIDHFAWSAASSTASTNRPR